MASCAQARLQKMAHVVISTELGVIFLALKPDTAPVTVAHVARHVKEGLYHDTTFYRSDFVVQFGMHGTAKASSHPPLAVNESGRGASNVRGSAAIAHHDKPDCGSTEIFINLSDNTHLDAAYGGYAVFTAVAADDAASWATVSAIAAAVKQGRKPRIIKAEVA